MYTHWDKEGHWVTTEKYFFINHPEQFYTYWCHNKNGDPAFCAFFIFLPFYFYYIAQKYWSVKDWKVKNKKKVAKFVLSLNTVRQCSGYDPSEVYVLDMSLTLTFWSLWQALSWIYISIYSFELENLINFCLCMHVYIHTHAGKGQEIRTLQNISYL